MNQWFHCRSFFCVIHTSAYVAGLFLLFASGYLNATEWSLNSSVNARYEYNDNIFVTSLPHESVTSLVVQPDIKFNAKEKNWASMFEARLRSNNYSDSNLDSNDQYYLVDGSYKRERDSYSLKGIYDLNSNLDTEADAFGLTGKRINSTTKTISPAYSRMLTERFLVSLGYTLISTDYDDVINTGFVPYEADIGSVSVVYNLTERDKLNASVQYIDYTSIDGLSEYQLLTSKAGLSRQFSDGFSGDFQLGSSQRDSISRATSTIDFFGTTVSLTQETDFNNKGYVLDTGLEYKTETSSISGRLSRDNVTSSYGSVDEVDKLSLAYNRKLSERWGYVLDGRYEKTSAVISGASFTDSNLLSVSGDVSYSLDRGWKITASWRYLEREFITQTQANVPHSNKLYIGMTYNFSEASTF